MVAPCHVHRYCSIVNRNTRRQLGVGSKLSLLFIVNQQFLSTGAVCQPQVRFKACGNANLQCEPVRLALPTNRNISTNRWEDSSSPLQMADFWFYPALLKSGPYRLHTENVL
jgi:hypothetical protein